MTATRKKIIHTMNGEVIFEYCNGCDILLIDEEIKHYKNLCLNCYNKKQEE